MKHLLLTALLFCFASTGFAQTNLISYDDLSYLLHNNINKADTFFTAKGHTLVKKDEKKNLRNYSLKIPGGTYVNTNVRVDGRRMYVEMETNELAQYNMIYNSISQYLDKESATPDVQTFTVKDLGVIYVMVNDAVPYNPIRREYTIRIVANKGITAYN
ncbi:hypothetical protein EWM62_02145 [Mucilaginibacter terrigena]|uniref:DUF4251 domain-containing protein n=1 Tax=Mucilaginibacter terrigena TaxID=2492395 RepID=A0A4Q5LRS4_9SPHI|nr:hypothetical protein [Mucilaginibacter terrigena]RYU92258.1 hypothetical protein EWM62_02145 [Mucilaginibacter terrigena]